MNAGIVCLLVAAAVAFVNACILLVACLCRPRRQRRATTQHTEPQPWHVACNFETAQDVPPEHFWAKRLSPPPSGVDTVASDGGLDASRELELREAVGRMLALGDAIHSISPEHLEQKFGRKWATENAIHATDVLGTGVTGRVYRGTHCGAAVAFKVINQTKPCEKMLEYVRKSVLPVVLAQRTPEFPIDHPHVLPLIDCLLFPQWYSLLELARENDVRASHAVSDLGALPVHDMSQRAFELTRYHRASAEGVSDTDELPLFLLDADAQQPTAMSLPFAASSVTNHVPRNILDLLLAGQGSPPEALEGSAYTGLDVSESAGAGGAAASASPPTGAASSGELRPAASGGASEVPSASPGAPSADPLQEDAARRFAAHSERLGAGVSHSLPPLEQRPPTSGHRRPWFHNPFMDASFAVDAAAGRRVGGQASGDAAAHAPGRTELMLSSQIVMITPLCELGTISALIQGASSLPLACVPERVRSEMAEEVGVSVPGGNRRVRWERPSHAAGRQRATVSITDLPPPWRMVLKTQILLQVVEGVKALHAAALVHCDIKPDNVFLCPDPRFAPFGVCARIGDMDTCRSLTGAHGFGLFRSRAGNLKGAEQAPAGSGGVSSGDVHHAGSTPTSQQNNSAGGNGTGQSASISAASGDSHSAASYFTTCLKGTPGFLSPEMILHGRVAPSTDVFSLAVTASIVLARRHRFYKHDDIRIRSMPEFGDAVSPDVIQTLTDCLLPDPRARPTLTRLKDALQAQFQRSLNEAMSGGV